MLSPRLLATVPCPPQSALVPGQPRSPPAVRAGTSTLPAALGRGRQSKARAAWAAEAAEPGRGPVRRSSAAVSGRGRAAARQARRAHRRGTAGTAGEPKLPRAAATPDPLLSPFLHPARQGPPRGAAAARRARPTWGRHQRRSRGPATGATTYRALRRRTRSMRAAPQRLSGNQWAGRSAQGHAGSCSPREPARWRGCCSGPLPRRSGALGRDRALPAWVPLGRAPLAPWGLSVGATEALTFPAPTSIRDRGRVWWRRLAAATVIPRERWGHGAGGAPARRPKAAPGRSGSPGSSRAGGGRGPAPLRRAGRRSRVGASGRRLSPGMERPARSALGCCLCCASLRRRLQNKAGS